MWLWVILISLSNLKRVRLCDPSRHRKCNVAKSRGTDWKRRDKSVRHFLIWSCRKCVPHQVSHLHSLIFYLQCIYTLGGGEFLLLSDYKELAARGISAEQEILTRHFTYFGPVPEGLYRQVNDKNWSEAMKEASDTADLAFKDQPELRFTWWSQELGAAAQDIISGMTNLDPAARTTIDHVLSHRWWQQIE